MAPGRAWFLLLLSPVPAILAGAGAALASGVSPLAFAPNAAAAVLGALLATGLGRLRRGPGGHGKAGLALGLAAMVALASTLGFEGVQGVHRWIELGPIRLNASAVFAPAILLGLSMAFDLRGAALALAALGIHLAQPDAGQQTALALGMGVLLLRGAGRRAVRLLLGAAVVSVTTWTWTRPDPLEPVPQVEQIYALGLAAGPLWTLAMGLSLALLVGPVVWRAERQREAPLAAALAAYLLASLAVPLLGAFPVPVLGAGAGPVLGWYLALGLLVGRANRGSTRPGLP